MKEQRGQLHFTRLKRAFKRIGGLIPKGKPAKRIRRRRQRPYGE